MFPDGLVLAFAALPVIIFVSSVFTVLYHLRVLPLLVTLMARLMMPLMRTSGAETLSAAANVFMGQTEAPIIVKPYIAGMTRSELLTLMTGGLATIAGSVLGVYLSLGADPVALLTTSVMAAPCGLYLSKILMPETGRPATAGAVATAVRRDHVNVIDAAAGGAADGMRVAINVAAMLIAFLAFVAMVDFAIGLIRPGLSLARIFAVAFGPAAALLGVPAADVPAVADLLGTKLVTNEFVAYVKLGRRVRGRHQRPLPHAGDVRVDRLRQRRLGRHPHRRHRRPGPGSPGRPGPPQLPGPAGRFRRDADQRLDRRRPHLARRSSGESSMKIAVVYNSRAGEVVNPVGTPNEELIRMETIERIVSALEARGHQVLAMEGDKKLFKRLEEFLPTEVKGERPGFVFNLSYGVQGEARYTHVPAILELLGYRYLGSGPTGHAVCLDKGIAKTILREHDLPTPDFAMLDTPDAEMPELTYPLIVKPTSESVSFGLKTVHDEAELRAQVKVIYDKFRQPVLAEKKIRGREFNVGLIGNDPPDVFSPVELIHRRGRPGRRLYPRGQGGEQPAVDPSRLPGADRRCARCGGERTRRTRFRRPGVSRLRPRRPPAGHRGQQAPHPGAQQPPEPGRARLLSGRGGALRPRLRRVREQAGRRGHGAASRHTRSAADQAVGSVADVADRSERAGLLVHRRAPR